MLPSGILRKKHIEIDTFNIVIENSGNSINPCRNIYTKSLLCAPALPSLVFHCNFKPLARITLSCNQKDVACSYFTRNLMETETPTVREHTLMEQCLWYINSLLHWTALPSTMSKHLTILVSFSPPPPNYYCLYRTVTICFQCKL